ncbi:multicopper oxidase family protein [Pseudaminobacter sp. NGMCC 1.201702]|uniref:multicopper oxidase family protein n=1 Tax=Pseudaminobacter sp. NGMCC 1.201702 TaxID=3391825 RepID=UPI0039EFF8C2
MSRISRRGFLAVSAATLSAAALPRFAFAQNAMSLSAATRVLDVDGRAATVFGLEGPKGQGLFLNPGERFRVDLTNRLDAPTLIHWHGQIPPNEQDGVPDLPRPMLHPGETRSYDYEPLPGTYWMHAHLPLQEMNLLAAPLIVRGADDVKADRQEVVMFLHDFSFKAPEEIMQELTGGHGGGHDMHAMGGASAPAASMDHSSMRRDVSSMHMDMSPMQGMTMDLNDYNWDAYLTNDRTLSDPDVVRVERGGRIRLRVINGASATVFWIDTGALSARLVAVDGHSVQALGGNRFGIAMGQRLDLDLELSGAGAWPILGLREGAKERTGLILATPGAVIERISMLAETAAPAFDLDLSLEQKLRAAETLPSRATQRTHMVMLGGSMQPYVWTIDGKIWGEHKPIVARTGERVEIMFHNMSMTGHPMHLHGHVFQVVDINGKRIEGAQRDTVYIPPKGMVTVALDAGEAARWMLHCHHMPHLQTGMMTEFSVSA